MEPHRPLSLRRDNLCVNPSRVVRPNDKWCKAALKLPQQVESAARWHDAENSKNLLQLQTFPLGKRDASGYTDAVRRTEGHGVLASTRSRIALITSVIVFDRATKSGLFTRSIATTKLQM